MYKDRNYWKAKAEGEQLARQAVQEEVSLETTPAEPNICANCLQNCKFDTIDQAKCNDYINANDNEI